MGKDKKQPQTKNLRLRLIMIGWVMIFAVLALDTSLAVPIYEIYSDKVSSPVRLVLLTDFHGSNYAGNYGDGQEVLIDAVKALEPDAVLLGGDFFNTVFDSKNSLELLEALGKEDIPCYYSTGNHEKWRGDTDGIKETVRSYGITVLDGKGETVSFRGQEIRICGVDYGFENYAGALDGLADEDVFTVLISHRPDLADEYSGKGFGLVLCGHAHGGQVRIPYLLNGLYAPDQGLFPKYAGGLYLLDDGSTEMIVSRGLCKNLIPRVFNRPEIVVIDIK